MTLATPGETRRPSRLPRARWWDSRLLLGMLLVLLSIGIGTRVIAAADDTAPVWVAADDLAEGSTLLADDLDVVQVRLDESAARYVGTEGESPVGAVISRDIAAGELLPVAALTGAGSTDLRLVTMPVDDHHFPSDLSRGDRVDVYVTSDSAEPGSAPDSELVLEDVRVERVEETGSRLGSAGGIGVTVAVDPDLVRAAVNGVQRGKVDLVLAAA